MKIKKVIAVIAGIAVALSAAVGGVYGYKSYQDKKLVAEVQPVSSLNWGYWERRRQVTAPSRTIPHRRSIWMIPG